MPEVIASLLGAAVALSAVAVAYAVGLTVRRARQDAAAAAGRPDDGGLGAEASAVLEALRSSSIVVDRSGAVVSANHLASATGLVRGRELVHPELRDLTRKVRSDGEVCEAELDLPRGPIGSGRLSLGVRVARVTDDHVLVLVDDRTQARRVEETRRDFVANVSHELKTPVGGLALLAEAVADARDDPEAVERFARRMTVEATRLTRLVTEIVDLTRLQTAEGLADPVLVDMRSCAQEAVDHASLTAQDRGIDVAVSTPPEQCLVWGDRDLIVTALRNLVLNAVTYSDRGSRVAVAVTRRDPFVEAVVADQGVGIPVAEQQRVFERFYRVDPARSRATGGTGLGLSIVKHVAANHGGDVTLWSEPGRGSTFTMRLPAADSRPGQPPGIPTPPATASPTTEEAPR